MPRPKSSPPALVAAASEVERALQSYERVASELLALEVSSQKRLHRAGRLLGEVCDAEDHLREQLGALVRVIGEARERQEARVQQVAARAGELGERTETYRGLMLRLEALGKSVGAIAHEEGVDLGTVQHQVAVALEQAEGLEADAGEAGFEDVAREVRGRKEQLAALLNRIGRATELPEA